MDDHIKQALDIVKAQAGFRTMSEEEMASMVRALAAVVRELSQGGTEPPSPAVDRQDRRITEKAVTCLECGKSFKLLTRRHLLGHGLNPEDYREKWDLPKDLPLVCKALQRERRKKMKDMKLWEKRRKNK